MLYEATATYDRIFPLHNMMGWPPEVEIDASTVLRNQPYGLQDAGAPAVGNCP